MTGEKTWWRNAVLYQIYPRSFFDSNGDGIGDLKGITKKLDYIASLGVDGVWLSPFFTSPMADFGYDVSDYCGVDPIFGTLDDFDEMLDSMHKRGLKLIIDFVMSHSSIAHPWFTESRSGKTNPKADWYVWADPKPDGTPPNNWISVFNGPAWTFDAQRGQYYYHQFLKDQPDLNIRNPEVVEALFSAARWWLDKGVDGFRLDALQHCIHDPGLHDNPARPLPPPDGKTIPRPYDMQQHKYDRNQPEMIGFCKKLRSLADDYKDRMLLAEVSGTETTIAYTNGPDMLHTAYNFSLLSHAYGADAFQEALGDFFDTPHESWPSWAMSNHDTIRAATRWSPDGRRHPAQAKMLLALLMSMRGTPFIYQGEELGLTESFVPPDQRVDTGLGLTGTGRDGCRTPMPWQKRKANAGFSKAKNTWLPVPDAHMPLAVDMQEKDKESVLHFTRRFISWRKKQPTLLEGDIMFPDGYKNVFCFTRRLGGEELFCAFNLHPESVTLPLRNDIIPLEGHGFAPANKDSGSLSLPGFGAYFGRSVAA
ncbi:MAG: alpha-glucosidase family protein [Alphaproteobacteria bacterium]|nr:alpha-glucosidase family protein [Alphaproteobacteria bacterium]